MILPPPASCGYCYFFSDKHNQLRMPNQLAQAAPTSETFSANTYLYSLAGAATLSALYFADQNTYLFSHGFVELFSIVMMLTVFTIIWSSRNHLTNEYFLLVGSSFLFIAGLDLTRALLYDGAGSVTGATETNITTQLWIATRMFQAGVLVSAPFFIGKKIRIGTFLVCSAAIAALILLSIFYWPIFPAAYTPDAGSTLFKTLSEYAISAFLFAALMLLNKKRAHFETGVFYLMQSFIFIGLLSELFFAFGLDTQISLNQLGHLLSAIALYLFTQAVVIVGFKSSYARLLQEYSQKMLEGKARDDALLLSIADGILVTDTSGKIMFVNKALEKICGVRSEKILGQDLNEAIPFFDERGRNVSRDVRPIYLALAAKVSKDLPIYTATDFHMIHPKTKRKVPLSINATPLIINKKISGAVVVWRDITQEREVDRAKSEFISYASHQLRTPLTSLSLSVDMLLNHLGDTLTKEQKKYLKVALRGTKDMTELIDTLLNISRIQMGTMIIDPRPTDLAKFVEKILQEISVSIKEKRIKIKKAYDADIPIVRIDEHVMEIVLENLLSNAVKYSLDQGTILIEMKKRKTDVLIAISDMGEGVPEDQQEKIFEKLFRVHPDSRIKGSGLGLYIVKEAVDQYGGRVWCESPSSRAFDGQTPGPGQKGSTFLVTVPMTGMRARRGTGE